MTSMWPLFRGLLWFLKPPGASVLRIRPWAEPEAASCWGLWKFIPCPLPGDSLRLTLRFPRTPPPLLQTELRHASDTLVCRCAGSGRSEPRRDSLVSDLGPCPPSSLMSCRVTRNTEGVEWGRAGPCTPPPRQCPHGGALCSLQTASRLCPPVCPVKGMAARPFPGCVGGQRDGCQAATCFGRSPSSTGNSGRGGRRGALSSTRGPRRAGDLEPPWPILNYGS